MSNGTAKKVRISEEKIGGPVTVSEIFSGPDDGIKLQTFLANIALQIIIRQLQSDDEKIALMCDGLYGNAAVWALEWYHSTNDHKFELFKKQFIEHFAVKVDYNKIINQLLEMKQSTLGLEQYNLKFNEYVRFFPPEITVQDFLLCFYLRGLENRTAQLVLYGQPKTLLAACKSAEQIRSFDELRGIDINKTHKKTFYGTNSANGMIDHNQKSLNISAAPVLYNSQRFNNHSRSKQNMKYGKQKKYNNRHNAPKCYGCGKMGHLVRYCPEKPTKEDSP
ncbi:AGL178W family transposase [Vanderwaltozyma polyspora DSM 70294]|uniref:AGL178W family transposase n=1 Tax=Vanderwaltozyma polyspora (strain ATCC 22028 / DSM 70294 / BCRC 21397 / CBS 2163 / NBRC 10782 / NRRL Y-8283 / UCD 57-17) TaxID=436907 RepID=A7TTB5_VANPO|nr:AGL178W family transposase [Vanderwaltozyma polyspora DSM 70294]EDO14497.1 AGL178W family transposase [Vanderwaltozyma polyspora DSM 70294]